MLTFVPFSPVNIKIPSRTEDDVYTVEIIYYHASCDLTRKEDVRSCFN